MPYPTTLEKTLRLTGKVLKSSDRRFLALVQASALIVWITDPAGNLTEENFSWEEYTGQTYEQYQNGGAFEAIHPEDREQVSDKWKLAIQTGLTCEAEFRLRNHKGEYRHFLTRSIPVFTNNGRSILEWVGTSTDITEKKRQEAQLIEAYEREHSIAQTLQTALLLKPPSTQFPGFDVSMFYEAASSEAAIGGDFFDAFQVNGKYAFIVGDVSGKGLRAATRTAEIKFALRAMLYNNTRPDVVLEKLNNFYLAGQDNNKADIGTFVVLSMLIVDPETGEGWFAKAGAEPPLWIDAKGRQKSLGAGGLPIGVQVNESYAQMTVKIAPGDMIALFTDGITEARCENQWFGYANLKQLFRHHHKCVFLEDCGRRIMDAIRSWTGSNFSDDVCMVLIRRKK